MEASEIHIEPAYEFAEPNECVVLARDRAIVDLKGGRCFGEAVVRLKLLPRAGIQIGLQFDQPVSQIDPSTLEGTLRLESSGAEVPGFISNASLLPISPAEIVWVPSSEPITGVGDDTTPISNIVFHLFNFKRIFGLRRTTMTVGRSISAIEHVDLSAFGWTIELQSLAETSARIKGLNTDGGYGLTHVGCLRRTDGTMFLGQEARDALTMLRYFLSFAQGVWCNPICPVGFDKSQNRVWAQWSSPGEHWSSLESWFDPQHCNQLVELLPGFWNRWSDSNWQSTMREVIYWYRNANNSQRGIDAGIILTQAALERLSYEYCVREGKLMESQRFKKLRASDKFRKLLTSLDIPIDLPQSLAKLASESATRKWQDGPHALTEIRNSLVHPEHKQRGILSECYIDAWKLGLQYLELSMLCVCDYSGTYSNRLEQRWVGEIEKVPWAV